MALEGSTTEEVRQQILAKLYKQRAAEAGENEDATAEPTLITTGADLGCTVSYNDMFEVPCESVGLVNFSLDHYMYQVGRVHEDQVKLIPKLDINYKEQPEVLWMIAYCIVNDHIALLQGMQGTGKTSGLEYVCAKLRTPLMKINCSSNQDSASIAGQVQVVNEGGVPVTKYVGNTDFMVNMQRGVVCLLDEIFWAPDDLRGGTLMRYRDKPSDGSPRMLTAPEDTSGSFGVPCAEISRIFYADNTLGLGDNADKFAARFVADTAFLDGINYVIKVDYLDWEDELALIRSWCPELEEKTGKLLTQLAGLIRSGFKNGDLPVTMSPRTLRAWAHATIDLNGNPIKALRYSYYNKLSEDSEKDCLRSMVDTVGFSATYGTL